MDDDSICSLVLHHNAPKFLVHVRNGCLRKAAGSSSPGSDVSNNRVAHYQSPGLGCALSWMPLSARPWAPVSSNVSCWLIQSESLSSSAFTSLRISHGLLTQMQCWRRHISVSSSWDGWGSLERAPESSGPSTPALWRASWPAVSPPGLETAPLATAGLCKGSCELPATLLEVSFPPSRISTPGGVQGKPGGLSKTPATRPTDCSLCCPQDDVSAASDPALADWGTAFSLRLSG